MQGVAALAQAPRRLQRVQVATAVVVVVEPHLALALLALQIEAAVVAVVDNL
jgi:hypothetical protein